MNDLEALVSEYTEQINILDTGLSSQVKFAFFENIHYYFLYKYKSTSDID